MCAMYGIYIIWDVYIMGCVYGTGCVHKIIWVYIIWVGA